MGEEMVLSLLNILSLCQESFENPYQIFIPTASQNRHLTLVCHRAIHTLISHV